MPVAGESMLTRFGRQRQTAPRRWRTVSGELAWVAIGQAAAAAGSLVTIGVLTRALTPAAYGELALGLTVATLSQQLVSSALSGSFLRFFAAAQELRRLNSYLRSVRSLVAHATLAMCTLGFVLLIALGSLAGTRWLALLLAALLFALLSTYESALDSMQNAARHRRVVAWHQGVGVWLRLALAAAFVSLLGPFSAAAMLGFALGTLVVLVSQFAFFRRGFLSRRKEHLPADTEEARDLARRMRAYAWPISAWGVFTAAQFVSDRWALQALTTTSTVGLYMVLTQLGYYPMSLLSAATLQFTSPVLFERAGDGSDTERCYQAWRLIVTVVGATLAISLVATALALAFHGFIFALLVDPDYGAVSGLLAWMVLSGGLFAAGQAAALSLMIGMGTRQLLWPKVATSLFSFALYLVGAQVWGLAGVVYANVAFGAAYFGWMARLALGWRRKMTENSGTGDTALTTKPPAAHDRPTTT